VKTCAEYFKAVDEDLHAQNESDGAAEALVFRKRCGPLWFLRAAWPSRTSYVGDLRFDVPAPLALLPAKFDENLSAVETAERDALAARGATLAQVHPGLVVLKKDAISVSWKEPPPGDIEATVDIAAFGDIDHDGLEDVLLFQSSHSTVGTYRGGKHYVVTRKKKGGPLVVDMDPDM
jgi:hypothetical protein